MEFGKTKQKHHQKESGAQHVALKMPFGHSEPIVINDYQRSPVLEYYDEQLLKNELDDHPEKKAIPETQYPLRRKALIIFYIFLRLSIEHIIYHER